MKKTNPISDEDLLRIRRGGSWYALARSARASIRDRDGASYRVFNLGFRLVRNK